MQITAVVVLVAAGGVINVEIHPGFRPDGFLRVPQITEFYAWSEIDESPPSGEEALSSSSPPGLPMVAINVNCVAISLAYIGNEANCWKMRMGSSVGLHL